MTQENELPRDVRTLLHEHIESYEQLEVLLVLHRERDKSWSVQDLSSRLHLAAELTAAALGSLRASGLVRVLASKSEPDYEYSPTNPAMDEAVDRLAREYREQPLRIIKLM